MSGAGGPSGGSGSGGRGEGRHSQVARRPPGPSLRASGIEQDGTEDESSLSVLPTSMVAAVIGADAPQGDPWKPGSVVANRYVIEASLGRGGMGEVLLADDLFLRRKVAIKTLRKELAHKPKALEGLRHEVAMAHAVNHPNLVRTFDLGEAGGQTFLTMEYLPGESLKARIKREGALPIPEVQRIGVEVALAMHASHKAGVVHRDLKPGNVQLTPKRGAVVVDFGLSAATEGPPAGRPAVDSRSAYMKPSSSSVGTPRYMAPEQWRSEPQGPATDIYAFGCILHEMLSGRYAFDGENRAQVMRAHLEDPIPSARAKRPEVPQALDQLVARCLAKDPAQRPKSMLEVAQGLTPRSLVPHLVTAGMGTAALLLVLLAGWALWHVSKGLLISQMRPAARCLAEQLATRVDLRDLQQIRSPEDIDSERFQRNWRHIDQLRGAYDVARYAYTMRLVRPPYGWEFVVDADPRDQDRDGDGVLFEDEKGSPPGMPYSGREYPGLTRVAQEKTSMAEDDVRSDAWGILLSGYAPVLPKDGAPDDGTVYIAGVDLYYRPLVRLRLALIIVFSLLGVAAAATTVTLRVIATRDLLGRVG